MSIVLKKRTLEQQANELRNKWALTLFEPIRLKSLLMQLRVLTVFEPLNSSISGMALKITTVPTSMRFMLINNNCTLGRQHFTICHELYHLFVQKDFHSQFCQTGTFNKKDKEEFNADWFASFFLLPEAGVRRQIPKIEQEKKNSISIATILRIEQYFSCSRAALLVRLEDLDLISREYAQQFKANVKRSAREHGYSVSIYERGNRGTIIGDYGEKARLLFEQEAISESHYAALMHDIGVNIFLDETPNNEPENHLT